MKMETEIEAGCIFSKASVTLGVETQSSKSEQITDTMTIKPGKSIALYQEVKEYDIWSGSIKNMIGVLEDNCTEITFLEGGVDQEFPKIKFM